MLILTVICDFYTVAGVHGQLFLYTAAEKWYLQIMINQLVCPLAYKNSATTERDAGLLWSPTGPSRSHTAIIHK